MLRRWSFMITKGVMARLKSTIPPQKNAIIRAEEVFQERNRTLHRIENLGEGREGGKAWKKETGYHVRSLAETGIFRFKTILGDNLQSRYFENQRKEARIKACVLNKITHVGMPLSVLVE